MVTPLEEAVPFVHPNHETPWKKQAKALRKRSKTIKTEVAKERYREKIQALTEQHKAFMEPLLATKETLEKYIEDATNK